MYKLVQVQIDLLVQTHAPRQTSRETNMLPFQKWKGHSMVPTVLYTTITDQISDANISPFEPPFAFQDFISTHEYTARILVKKYGSLEKAPFIYANKNSQITLRVRVSLLVIAYTYLPMNTSCYEKALEIRRVGLDYIIYATEYSFSFHLNP